MWCKRCAGGGDSSVQRSMSDNWLIWCWKLSNVNALACSSQQSKCESLWLYRCPSTPHWSSCAYHCHNYDESTTTPLTPDRVCCQSDDFSWWQFHTRSTMCGDVIIIADPANWCRWDKLLVISMLQNSSRSSLTIGMQCARDKWKLVTLSSRVANDLARRLGITNWWLISKTRTCLIDTRFVVAALSSYIKNTISDCFASTFLACQMCFVISGVMLV